MRTSDRYGIREVAERAGVSDKTIRRWLREEKIPEPDRDRNGWRTFTEAEVAAIVRYAKRIVPSPRKRQRKLQFEPPK